MRKCNLYSTGEIQKEIYIDIKIFREKFFTKSNWTATSSVEDENFHNGGGGGDEYDTTTHIFDGQIWSL